jgi:membrane-associated protease RseP (regulator of RpoE activity)
LFLGLFALGAAGGAAAWAAKGKSTKVKRGNHGFSVHVGSTGSLGADVQDLTEDLRSHFGAPSDAGVLVGAVEPGSAAERAGLKVGDVIVSVNGEDIEASWDLMGALWDKQSGDTVELEVVRDRKDLKLSTELTDDDLPQVMTHGGRMGVHHFNLPQIRQIPQIYIGGGAHGFGFSTGGNDDLVERLDKAEDRVRQLEDRLEKLEKKLTK